MVPEDELNLGDLRLLEVDNRIVLPVFYIVELHWKYQTGRVYSCISYCTQTFYIAFFYLDSK